MKLLAFLLALAAVPGACWPEAKFYGPIEVWNRTTEPITVVAPGPAARDKDEFRVEPCGHAARERFLVSRFEVLDGEGQSILISGSGGPEPDDVRPVYLIVTSRGVEGVNAPPTDLPPCR